jgi:hypothetical protein
MRKFFAMLALAVFLGAVAIGTSGCKSSDDGSREFIPGKGWKRV